MIVIPKPHQDEFTLSFLGRFRIWNGLERHDDYCSGVKRRFKVRGEEKPKSQFGTLVWPGLNGHRVKH